MASYIFNKIAKEGQRAGIKIGTEDARDWFRDSATPVSGVSQKQLMSDRSAMTNKITNQDIGRMLMFQYDPKGKKTLPYYDKFPLIFMVEQYNDGFLGINLHYLPPMYRARLMDALYSVEMNDRQRQSKKIKINYQIIKCDYLI